MNPKTSLQCNGALIALILLALVAGINSAQAAIWYVWQGSATDGPGTSWNNAFQDIQSAIDAAAAGDTVLVTNGTYATGTRVVYGAVSNRVAVTKPLYLQSVNGAGATMIQGGTATRCVFLTNGASLSGFTLSGGYTLQSSALASDVSGGGLYCASATAQAINCVISYNSAYRSGGGAYGGTLQNCTLAGNEASSFSGYGTGGGAYQCTLNNCTLSNNVAGSGGGGAYFGNLDNCTLTGNQAKTGVGGGANGASLTFCHLAGNWAFAGGGAAACTLTNCTLVSNTTYGNGAISGEDGGGAYQCTLTYCTLTGNLTGQGSGGGASGGTLNNCTLTDNSTTIGFEGGGAYGGTLNSCLLTGNAASAYGGAAGCTLNNCTLVSNSASSFPSGAGACTLNNCILYDNVGPSGLSNYDSSSSLNYCCTTPLPPSGTGNITGPPLFVNEAGGNFQLQSNSPCINAGDIAFVTTATDLAGNPRLIDNTVDMGAYEYQRLPLILTWASPAPITYGMALSPNQLNATANLPGNFAYNPTNGAVLDAGANTLYVIFTPSNTLDYTSVTDSVSLLVSCATLTVTASNASRAYGQTNPVFGGTITGLTNGDNITAMYSCNASNASPPGTYFIVPSLVDPNDRQTNYCVSLVNGTLTVEPLPIILNQPQSQTVLVETNVTFSVTATNTAPALPPLSYQWQFNGTNLSDATNVVLALPLVSLDQAGLYEVVVASTYGAVTSNPALLDVRPIFVFVNGGLLTGTNYTFIGPTTVTFVTGFSNGSMYYTLDGSQPSFFATYYQSPFMVEASSLLRAVAYSADFSEYGEMPPIAITIHPGYVINYLPSPGGSVSASPSNSSYAPGSQVNLQAAPNPGWTFLNWFGDVSGGNTNVMLTMDSSKTVQAVFGTTLGETVAGHGTVTVDPSSSLYPYGTTVRLTANPASGYAFATWGNAAAGISTNPLYFTITNAVPVISSLFVPLSGNQASLTIQISGNGQVTANPLSNTYALNSIVALTAIPDPGQQFLGWSGAASGGSTNFSLAMTQSETVLAAFSHAPSLSVNPPLNGLFNSGFRLTITSDFGAVCDLEASTNLSDWYSIITLTNTYGMAQFTDSEATTNNAIFYRLLLPP